MESGPFESLRGLQARLIVSPATGIYHYHSAINNFDCVPRRVGLSDNHVRKSTPLGIIWTPKPSKIIHQDTHHFGGVISLNVNFKHIIEFFHINIIPMTLCNDIMPSHSK